MMKIYMIYDVPNWSYYAITSALIKYSPHDMKITHGNRLPKRVHDYDLILNLDYGKTPKYHSSKVKMYRVKFIQYVCVQFPHNIEYYHETDFTVFCNRLSYEYLNKPENSCVIFDSTDLSIFYNEKRPDRRDTAILCSSKFHQKLKGVEKARELDNIEILVSDSHHPVKNSDQMRYWYNSAKVYLCLSQLDGTPRPVLEAAACGCVIVSTPVGIVPDLVRHGFNGLILPPNPSKLLIEHMIDDAIINYEQYVINMDEIIKDWCWSKRSLEFYSLFRKLING